MMLHRHFETGTSRNITTLADVTPTPKQDFVSDVFPPEEETVEAPKRNKRKKTDE